MKLTALVAVGAVLLAAILTLYPIKNWLCVLIIMFGGKPARANANTAVGLRQTKANIPVTDAERHDD